MIKKMIFTFMTFGILASGQNYDESKNIIINSGNEKTSISYNEKDELIVNISKNDSQKFQKSGIVKYSDFGAKGNGKNDDIDALAATHAYANEYNLKVKADEGATYYISGKDRTVAIQTDTDFGSAVFFIDDTEVLNRNASIFSVNSNHQPVDVKGITSLKRNQKKLDISSPGISLIRVTNSHKKQFIRYGLNQNNGKSQTDIFIVDQEGNVNSDTPIIWDFDQISEITALEIDTTTLTISGGHFTTIANKAESRYTYYARNILITRSNVVVDGLEHHIKEEGDHGAPYSGFITIRNSADVKIKNTVLTGHKTYSTIGSAGKPVNMGSYDISVGTSINVSFINCSQTNDINDRTYWGIFGSNFCKNLVYDQCTLSRFDAHMGVTNATIRNSELGYMGINAIGSGTFRVENSTIFGRNLINLRSDYGSTWEGNFIIRNCTFIPSNGSKSNASLIGGSNSEQHDFGYTCYMPYLITIDSLHIDDSNHPSGYNGPSVFTNFNKQLKDSSYEQKFPYIITKEVKINKVTTASGKKLRLSNNTYMFKDVKMNSK